jgi:putative glycosyl hydrolase-like family 6 (GHL6) protein
MNLTRREFLAKSAAVAFGAIALPSCVSPPVKTSRASLDQPWYRRTLRWGQTNITEADPAGYDISWWGNYWKRTRAQGVIVNAGGIVAYYPTRFPLQYRPAALGERDLFGELLHGARQDGLVVPARMDSSRTHENLYNAHPDWFAVDAAGKPHKAGELFVTCVNGPYYDEYLPEILREIAQRYRPEGFTDNSWAGLGREDICYCENCRRKF